MFYKSLEDEKMTGAGDDDDVMTCNIVTYQMRVTSHVTGPDIPDLSALFMSPQTLPCWYKP